MVEVEVLPAGERVPGLEALHVDRERRVPAAAGFRSRPLRGRDDGYRPGLRVGKGDLLALVLSRQIGQAGTRPALERPEALCGEVAIRGARQRENRLASVYVSRHLRSAICLAAAHGP